MRYYLSENAALKSLETFSVYDMCRDELYELDEDGFSWLAACSEPEGGDPENADAVFVDYCLSEGLLTEKKVSVRRSVIIKSPAPSLRYLELQITDKCNLKCKHCFVGSPQNNEISVMDLRRLLEEFEVMQGLRLMITGGEPLMHNGFREFNELLPRYAFRKILFTNGMLIDRNIIHSLNVDEIQFSVDGMNRGHDFLRGPGTFQRVIKAMETALASGMTVSVATMIHNENLTEFDEMDSLFRSLGVRDWTVDAPTPVGNMVFNTSLCAPPDIGGKLLEYGFGGGIHGSAEGFGCGYHLASVLANGDIAKCAFYYACPAGNIHEGLASAWARIRPVSLKSLKCSELLCPKLDECRGGCRYRASVMEGLPDRSLGADSCGAGCDFYKCYYYGIMKSGMKPL
jgi:radical SAM protein with 4Fe4S-binding SPASM domain